MADARDPSLADTMASVALVINRRVPLKDTLTAIVRAARDTIPGVDHAGISILHRRGRIETAAATDPLVIQADQLQYDLDEGPCVDAIRGERRAAVNDLRNDPRWPAYGPKAAALGIGSQAGIELYADADTIGGLNLYSHQTHAMNDETLHMAHLFAVHAAVALGHALAHSQLTESVATRQIIGQAVGIVMERYRLDDAHAFNFLVRVSQDRNVKLRSIAQEVVQEAAARQAKTD